jgi:hypothetical protein
MLAQVRRNSAQISFDQQLLSRKHPSLLLQKYLLSDADVRLVHTMELVVTISRLVKFIVNLVPASHLHV